ncbi:GNAT family N-acetyltransferase [soil metagenome]
MTITLTPENPRDPAVAAMIAELVTYITDLYPEDEDDPPAPWTVDNLAAFLVARVDGAPAACGGLAPMSDQSALEIVRMYVRPAHRGAGLADQILAALETAARTKGAQTLLLRCGPRQPAALRVYERNGYRRRAAFAHHREHETNIFLEKELCS